MAELVYALVLGTSVARLEGSSPSPGTNIWDIFCPDSKARARRCEAGSQDFSVEKDL